MDSNKGATKMPRLSDDVKNHILRADIYIGLKSLESMTTIYLAWPFYDGNL
jgi:hypothetical protein